MARNHVGSAGDDDLVHVADYQLRSLWGLWADTMYRGEYRAALALAEKFARVAAASADVGDSLVADRMIGYSLYILGERATARIHIEWMLNRYVAPANRLHIVRYQFDQRVTARISLAGILWLQGFPDQTMRVAEANIHGAKETDHAISLTYASAQSACPIALYVGDLAAAERFFDDAARPPVATCDGAVGSVGPMFQGRFTDKARRHEKGTAGAQRSARRISRERLPHALHSFSRRTRGGVRSRRLRPAWRQLTERSMPPGVAKRTGALRSSYGSMVRFS